LAIAISPVQVGNWLYGVARTTAVRAKAVNAKRRRRDLPAPITASRTVDSDAVSFESSQARSQAHVYPLTGRN
jgi:hypothetical protein